MADLLARSPLAGHRFAALTDVAVAERPVASLVQVAAFPDRFDAVSQALARAGLPPLPAPTASREGDGATILDVGPGRALVVSEAAGLFHRLDEEIAGDEGTVTDLSHARVCLRVAGPRAQWVMSKGVALDLHPSAFPAGAVAVTAIDHVGVIVHRVSVEAFDLFPYRGFALALVHWLEVAGRPDTPERRGAG